MKELEENEKNFFRILGVEENENVHSNMLAWMFDHKGRHGLKGMAIEYIIWHFDKDLSKAIEEVDKDFTSFSVLREVSFSDGENGEKGRMDILLVSDVAKCVICIENKVKSSEHSDQLTRYVDYLTKTYCANGKDYKTLFIYLTPAGENASDTRWHDFSYKELKAIIDDILYDHIASVESKLFIDYFREMLYDLVCFSNRVGGRDGDFSYSIFNCKERIKSDFPSLNLPIRNRHVAYNALFTDSSLKMFSPAEETGGYSNVKDLCYIDIKFEQAQRAKGVLACILVFTNHPKNLEEGSEFRRAFNPKSLTFRWYEAIKFEEQLLNEDELVEDFFHSEDAEQRFYAVVKSLLTKMDASLKEKGFK